MGKHTIKHIAVLTSSRADYGIYLPLLNRLKNNEGFKLSIIAFGSHCKEEYGSTINAIIDDGFDVFKSIDGLIIGDTPEIISKSYAKTHDLFASFWAENYKIFDSVLCLGDRFEMAAAVNAGVPFNVKFAHIHSGETTLGAIDNIYRHQISIASIFHFTSNENNLNRINSIVGNSFSSLNVGSLSLDNIKDFPLYSKEEFLKMWGIDLNKPTILITVHPETVNFEKNEIYAKELELALSELTSEYQLLITSSNIDTKSSVYAKMFNNILDKNKGKVFYISNLGVRSYFSCLSHVVLVMGNSSSGIIEVASFNKYVINIGDRQKGRYAGENVQNVKFDKREIVEATKKYAGLEFNGHNIYDRGGASELIISKLKNL